MNTELYESRSCYYHEHKMRVNGYLVRYSIIENTIITYVDDVSFVDQLIRERKEIEVTMLESESSNNLDDGDFIVGIFSRNNLNLGLVMPDWFDLVKIVGIDLSNFHWMVRQHINNGLLPIERMNFPYLRKLTMKDCDLPEIPKLKAPKIETLIISNNPLTCIDGIDMMYPNLKHLLLANCILTSVGKSLINLNNLKFLDLSGNKLFDFSKNILPTSIMILIISDCDLDENKIKFLNCFLSLIYLDVSNNKFKKVPSFIFDLLEISEPKLSSLNISSNNIKMIDSARLIEYPSIKCLKL